MSLLVVTRVPISAMQLLLALVVLLTRLKTCPVLVTFTTTSPTRRDIRPIPLANRPATPRKGIIRLTANPSLETSKPGTLAIRNMLFIAVYMVHRTPLTPTTTGLR